MLLGCLMPHARSCARSTSPVLVQLQTLAKRFTSLQNLQMAYIPVIEPDQAEGALKEIYSQAEQRAGRVFNILKIMSRSPHALRVSMDFYITIMHGKSPLSRAQREMLATVVSAANGCHY